MFCLFSEHLESVPHFSSILSRNAYKALVKYCQFDLVISLGFVYVHNPERSLRVYTEEQIITACVCKFIRVLFWNFLRPQLDCCVLRKENIHPPMDRSSILPAVIRAMITKTNVSYIPMIPSLYASLDKMSFACGCNFYLIL